MNGKRVLVVNPGSSSLKLSVLDASDELVAERDAPSRDGAAQREALEAFLAAEAAPDACGVRVVHGGREFRSSVRLDQGALRRLEAVAELAPLHNPPAIGAARTLIERWAETPVVACFDTAFHASLPEAAAVYAVPWRWTDEWGVRRYGFHGLSHAYASRRAAELLGVPLGGLRIVSCHLGAGASLAAVQGGRSVDTTMGFTPLEGLVMATRAGSLDPGAVLWVQRHGGLSPSEVERQLDRESGVLGLSGLSGDMREVEGAAEGGHERARLALDVYGHRLRGAIAAMAAAMGGVDALAFTGGVGEGSAAVRRSACGGLGFLGVRLDEGRNRGRRGDTVVSAPGSAVAVVVVRAREDLEIAREVRRVLSGR
jgi:acetate kinase